MFRQPGEECGELKFKNNFSEGHFDKFWTEMRDNETFMSQNID